MELQDFNRSIIDEFRRNGGRVSGPFADTPLLLLTTTGAKSAATRVNPLAYIEDGGRYVIVASYAGAPGNPPWYYNLVANPKVTVEVGSQTFAARAEVASEPERTALYAKVEARMPVFGDYRQKTSRTIPVVTLRRS
jgi:deazaflavin-dependent oxidoreductase (nitroreductase family)